MVILFFFFKQKTAYEMRISDWSSDVCSSDLRQIASIAGFRTRDGGAARIPYLIERSVAMRGVFRQPTFQAGGCRAARTHALHIGQQVQRSEERRVGKECVSTGRSRWSQYP